MSFLSVQQLRDLDARCVSDFGMNTLQLMENAGAGSAAWIVKNVPCCRCVVLCGPGNNGGDGYVVARHLDYFGYQVEVISLADPQRLRGDALVNAQIVQAMKLPVHIDADGKCEDIFVQLKNTDIVIDALLGTGAALPLRPNFRAAVCSANRSLARRIALDVPTGFDADSGNADPDCFRVHVTLTYAAKKLGFANSSSAGLIGKVEVISIGAPRCLMEAIDAQG